MWGFLLFAGVAWLAIGWSVLRLEPADVVPVAGPIIFFGALCEAVRALAGTRTWWLNAGMAVLFAATGVVVLADRDATYTTPASLIGWFLMVRGALDIAVSTMNRGVDRTWGLMLSLGVAQAGLGFFVSSPLARAADPVIVTLGGLALLRAVADLVTALRLREVAASRHDVLRLSPEREAGVAGYSAGHADFDDAPARHRAGQHEAGPHEAGRHEVGQQGADKHQVGQQGADKQVAGQQGPEQPGAGARQSFHDEVVATTGNLDSMIAKAGVTGSGTHRASDDDLPRVPDSPAEVAESPTGRPRG